MSLSSRPGRSPVRHPLHSRLQAPPLLRWLDSLAPPAHTRPAASRSPSFAEQLSPWLGWAEAITLASVLQQPVQPGTSAPAGAWAQARRVAAELVQVHRELVQDIHRDTRADDLPPHAARQAALQQRIAPARARLRLALAACTPALRQLAALDEVLDRALSGRERGLLATLPGLLQQQRRQASASDPATSADQPSEAQALRELLLAELQTRWQPVAGLLEALDEAAAAAPGGIA